MTGPSYYHGGIPGLPVGATVLPPAMTGAPSTADYGNKLCSRHHVYVATDPVAALLYAVMHPSGCGSVYLVKPVGQLTPDPDCSSPGLSFVSFACEKAMVLRQIIFSRKERRRAMQAALVA